MRLTSISVSVRWAFSARGRTLRMGLLLATFGTGAKKLLKRASSSAAASASADWPASTCWLPSFSPSICN